MISDSHYHLDYPNLYENLDALVQEQTKIMLINFLQSALL